MLSSESDQSVASIEDLKTTNPIVLEDKKIWIVLK